MKQEIVKLLQSALKEEKIEFSEDSILNLLETPPTLDMGDFAFPCFSFSKDLKKSPHEIALKLNEHIGEAPEGFEDIQTSGPYINFFLNKKTIATNLINEVEKEKDNYGNVPKLNKNFLIEFPSPNTNKPLHLGHMRNMAIGESVSRICEANGYGMIRVNLNNDRGTHICKSMLAYQKWGKPSKKKGDHLVGEYYVLFNEKLKEDKNLEVEAGEMLRKWEDGDEETIKLWKEMNGLALEGFKETYDKFGIKFDKEYFESEMYKEGKDIIMAGLEKGIFKQREDGAVVVDLEKEGLGEKVLLRSDGTSIYITQDIYLAKKKLEDFDLDQSIYVTGNEQEYHFKVLFEVLKRLELVKGDKLHHLSYGMVNLPEGRMKSREGTVVDADNLIGDVQNLVKKELKEREELSEEDLEDRSLKTALASIKYFLLKVDIRKNMVFNPKESISFEGDTGPYIQYAYARASSILRKAEAKEGFEVKDLEQKEIELITKLSLFKDLVVKSYETLNPSLIAHYAYQLAQTFNEFYHGCPVIGSDNEGFRLKLIETFRQILKNSLKLLGIDVLEVM